MSSLTIGVWGVDHPHGGGHLHTLRNTPDIDRLLIWDADPDKARVAADGNPKAEVVDDIDSLIEQRGLDAVVVLLPNRDAGPATLKAVRAGLYVYGDKPGARTSDQMRLIVQAAQATGAYFCPCYPWRVDPIVREIKGLIDTGVLGDLWSFEAKWLTSQVALRDASNWLFHDDVAGGGILAWLGCHWIDLLVYLLGPVAQVAAKVSTRCREDIDVEDTASVILQTASGAIGTVRAGYTHKPFEGYDDSDLCLSFEGHLGSIYWPPHADKGYRLRTGHPDYAGVSSRWVQLQRVKDDQGYSHAFFQAFLRAVTQGVAPPATQQDALRVMQVYEAAYASSLGGQHITIEA